MEQIYTICMVIGVGMPAILLILNGIGEVFEGALNIINIDISIDIGDFSISAIPISLQSICGGVLIFGAVGKLFYHQLGLLTTNIIGGVSGYIVAVLIQTLIRRLKKVENTTYNKEDLILMDAVGVNTIIKGGYGSISVTTPEGITINYPAKALDEAAVIKQNTKVFIMEFDKNTAIVKEADFDNKYEQFIKERN